MVRDRLVAVVLALGVLAVAGCAGGNSGARAAGGSGKPGAG